MERRKEVTMERIAEEVGASIVTVSNALKGKKGVSEELRRTICEAADRLGYRAVKKGQGKSYHIGIAVAESYVKEFPSFYMEVYQCAVQELTAGGSMAFLKVISEEPEESTGEAIFFPGVEIDGILLIGDMSKGYAVNLKEMYRVPVVCVGSYDISEEIDYVAADCFGGMEEVTELLLEAGHRDLLFVKSSMSSGNLTDCYLGYCKAMERRGMEVKSEILVQHFRMEDNRITADVCLPDALPDAFVCESAKCAGVLMEKLWEQGIKVPEDVSVAGFGRYYAAPQSEWRLTTYENDERALAHIGVRTIVKRLEGRRKTAGVRIVEGHIVQGNTAGEAGRTVQGNTVREAGRTVQENTAGEAGRTEQENMEVGVGRSIQGNALRKAGQTSWEV